MMIIDEWKEGERGERVVSYVAATRGCRSSQRGCGV